MTAVYWPPLINLTKYFSRYNQEDFKKDLEAANKAFSITKIKEILDKLDLEFNLDELSLVLSQSLMVFCLSDVQEKDLPYVELLFKKNIQKDYKNQDEQNYVMALLSSNKLRSREINLAVLRILLQNTIDPNIPDVYGVLPLEIATSHLCVELLVENGADPNKLGTLNCPPLYHVLKSKTDLSDESIKIVGFLIEKGAKDVDCIIDGYTKIRLSDLLDLKFFEGKELLVSTLKKNTNRSDEDLKLSNLIHLDPKEETKQTDLLKKRCICVYRNEKNESVKLEFLVAPPVEEKLSVADVIKFGDICSPKKINSFKDDLEEIKETFQKIHSSYPYLLHQALFDICGDLKNENQLKIAEMLIEKGADPNFRFEDGSTALTEICEKIKVGEDCFDELKLLQMLLENNADVNIFHMHAQEIQWPEEKDKLKFHSILTEKDITSWLEKHCIDTEEPIKLICYDEKITRSVLDFTFHPKAVEMLIEKGARVYGAKKPPSWVVTTKLEKAQCEKYQNIILISHLQETSKIYEKIKTELKPISKKS
ncbi:MAG: hypothetical protein K940chlam5_00874 [Candidatus Anoxychlamydiales bacterium]|nr:hypothetical protein [Candidatus Anoxychlamydiales bacterium]